MWFWIGTTIGVFGAALLGAARTDRRTPPSTMEPASLREMLSASTGVPVASITWDVRLNDERGQTVLTGSGATPEAALRDAAEHGRAQRTMTGGAA